MRKFNVVGVASIVVLSMFVSVEASDITFHGSSLDNAADWRTTTTAKPLDADGDNVYGTDGWATWLGSGYSANASDVRVSSLPTYVNNFSEGSGCGAYSGGGYVDIDDPNSNPPVKIVSGTITITPGQGVYCDLASFTVESFGSFSFGVMGDNLDDSQYNSVAYRLTSSLGNSCEITLDTTSGFSRTPDFYFFQVKDAVAGETFTLSGQGGGYGYATVAAVTWDTVSEVPEPSVIVLLLGGLVLLIFRRVK